MPTRSLYDKVCAELVETERASDLHVTHPTARRLIKAARTILTRDGFQGLTLEAVSTEAGVNKAATRYHFGNKDGLINATMAEIVLDECADHHPPKRSITPEERVDAIIENIRSISLNPESFAGFFELLPQAAKSEDINRHFVRLYQAWFDSNIDWLDLQNGDVPPDARRGLTMLLAAIIDGLCVQQTIFGDDFEPDAALDVLRVILAELIPRSAASD